MLFDKAYDRLVVPARKPNMLDRPNQGHCIDGHVVGEFERLLHIECYKQTTVTNVQFDKMLGLEFKRLSGVEIGRTGFFNFEFEL